MHRPVRGIIVLPGEQSSNHWAISTTQARVIDCHASQSIISPPHESTAQLMSAPANRLGITKAHSSFKKRNITHRHTKDVNQDQGCRHASHGHLRQPGQVCDTKFRPRASSIHVLRLPAEVRQVKHVIKLPIVIPPTTQEILMRCDARIGHRR